MVDGEQPPRSYSIHEAIARERTLSEASGSLSAFPNEQDVYSDEDDSPLGLHCLPTLSRRVSRHVCAMICISYSSSIHWHVSWADTSAFFI